MHCDYYIVYLRPPLIFKSAAIPYQHWCLLAPPTREQWYLFISPICLRQWYQAPPHLLEELDAIFGREMGG
jgi:hypothetical protein